MLTRRTMVVAGSTALTAYATGTPAADETDRNKRVVRGFFDRIYQGRPDQAFDEFCAPDYEFSIYSPDNARLNSAIPWAGTLHKGRQGFLNLNDLLFARSVDSLLFELGDMFSDKNMVVVFGHFKFKAKSTGKEFASDFVTRYWLHAGKLIRGRFYEDTFTVADAFRRSGTWDIENAGTKRTL